MSVSELKQLLIDRIISIDDEQYLNSIKILTDSEQNQLPYHVSGETRYELNAFEEEKIENARQQVKAGKTVPHGKVVDNVEKWLEE